MRISLELVTTLLTASAAGFPHILDRDALTASEQTALESVRQQVQESAANSQAVDAKPGWSPSQKISTTGAHEWRAPGPNDDRGPCPGLNALANHGYIARSGRASILDFIQATTSVFGMGPILATVLAAYGGAVDGAVLGWSIGGDKHTGIGGSRGNYETDNSPLRGDLYQYGSNTDLVISQFQDLVDLQPNDETANYDIDVLTQFRAHRYQESIEKNPYFYYGPFSGTLVSVAAYSFIYRFMANHTAEKPEGMLNLDVLKSFMSIEGESGNFTWVPGHERIPSNWYRRAPSSPYELYDIGSDASTFAKASPGVSKPGCNTGTVNSYVDISSSYQDFDFSGLGSVCFAIAGAAEAVGVVPIVSGVVLELLLPVQNLLGCSTVPSRNESVGDVCPGYSYYAGPRAEVAPGAVQG